MWNPSDWTDAAPRYDLRSACLYLTLSLTPECVLAFRHAHTNSNTHVCRIRASQDKRCCRQRPAAVIRLLSHTHTQQVLRLERGEMWLEMERQRQRRRKDIKKERDVGGGELKERGRNDPICSSSLPFRGELKTVCLCLCAFLSSISFLSSRKCDNTAVSPSTPSDVCQKLCVCVLIYDFCPELDSYGKHNYCFQRPSGHTPS